MALHVFFNISSISSKFEIKLASPPSRQSSLSNEAHLYFVFPDPSTAAAILVPCVLAPTTTAITVLFAFYDAPTAFALSRDVFSQAHIAASALSARPLDEL